MTGFQGDPAMFLTDKGATLIFKGGQPVMDAGWENYVLISLFTRPGWAGNVLFDNPAQQIGSDFEEVNELPITVDSFVRVEESAKRALAQMEEDGFAELIQVTSSNPSGRRRDTRILIKPPGESIQELLLIKNGLNWLAQINSPAHLKV